MSARKERRANLRLENQVAWTIPDFATLLGFDSETYVYERLVWNDAKTAGIVHLPGGVDVPVHRDGANGNGLIYRRQFEEAQDAAPRVHVVRQAPAPEWAD